MTSLVNLTRSSVGTRVLESELELALCLGSFFFGISGLWRLLLPLEVPSIPRVLHLLLAQQIAPYFVGRVDPLDFL